MVVGEDVYREVSAIFFARFVFRFNSEQAALLALKPRILGCLRNIEIEDEAEHRRMWDLDYMMKKLTESRKMQSVVTGCIYIGDQCVTEVNKSIFYYGGEET